MASSVRAPLTPSGSLVPILSYPSLPPTADVEQWDATFIHMLSMNKLAHGGLIVIRLRTLAGSRRAASSLLILRRHASG